MDAAIAVSGVLLSVMLGLFMWSDEEFRQRCERRYGNGNTKTKTSDDAEDTNSF